VPTELLQRPGYSKVIREPKGVILILSPWNFPIDLSLKTIGMAVAAGNCCLLKPSEVASASEEALARLIPKYLDTEAVQVMTGGPDVSTALISLRWDHIHYTGNGSVARIVAQAAAKNLVPCTLELGGKSPAIITSGANLNVAAKRLLFGKLFNTGQICIAPDYALVDEKIEAEFLRILLETLKTWHGEDAKASSHLGRIINKRHFHRLKNLLDTSDGTILAQNGKMDEDSCFMPPTLVHNPSKTSPIMQEEIFGPLLPIITCSSINDMISFINSKDKPLTMYIFAKKGPEIDQIIENTSSGSVCINDTIMQYANSNLPFGGIGESGTGRSHGKWGFDDFSHVRGIMYRDTWVDLPQRYPPYTDSNLKLFQRLLVGPIVPPGVKKAIMGAGAVTTAAILMRSRL